ncbi:MAG: hypothetical protein ACT6TH_07140 [Brevundimonas sp.]|uniref:hypothetical protein n=1 Tax=Brevundimonas sp. TaxID=1871086 RepID=UPI0040348CAA
MTDSPPSTSEQEILRGVVTRWEAELRAIDARRTQVIEKLSAAQRLLEVMGDEIIPAARAHSIPEEVSHSGTQLMIPEVGSRPVEVRSDAKWVDLVRQWVGAAFDGLSYAELRALIDKHPAIADRFALSDKGYYNALSRLVNRGELVRHNGRLFSAEAFERYRRKVATGVIADLPAPMPSAHSPMGEAVMDIVWASRESGIVGKDVIATLRTDPEFNASLTPHTSGAYNVIARLTKRAQLIRRDDGLIFPGTRMAPRSPDSKWIAGNEEGASM